MQMKQKSVQSILKSKKEFVWLVCPAGCFLLNEEDPGYWQKSKKNYTLQSFIKKHLYEKYSRKIYNCQSSPLLKLKKGPHGKCFAVTLRIFLE